MKISVLAILLLLPMYILAQNENDILEDSLFSFQQEAPWFDMSFAFKTQNYFRGLLPSKSPTFSSQVGVVWDHFFVGLYGGVGFDGVYQEIDWILSYYNSRFDVRLEYYYNFTQGITDIPEPSGIFDFNRETTRGLLDFIVDINLDGHNKWKLTSSTFLFGRDVVLHQEIVNGEPVLTRGDQRYSQFVVLARNWYWDTGKVEAHVGGSFSWADPSGAQFYGEKAGINDVGISYTKKLIINKKVQLPIKAAALLNPLSENMFLLITVNLIQINKL